MNTISEFMIWLALRGGKMKRILCSDQLPERARWAYRLGFPLCSRKSESFGKIINPALLVILVPSRWLTTVEPRYKDLRYNDIPDRTINIFQPGQCYSKMYGTKPEFKGTRSRFVHLEKFSPNFSSSSFAIRVNLLHP